MNGGASLYRRRVFAVFLICEGNAIGIRHIGKKIWLKKISLEFPGIFCSINDCCVAIVFLPETAETDTIRRQTITKTNKRLVSGSLHSPTAGYTIQKCFCSLLCLSGDNVVHFFRAPPLLSFLCSRCFSWVFKGGFLSSLDMHTLFPRRWPFRAEKKPSLAFVCCIAGNKGAGAGLEGPE